jgi:hypothetical protein
MTERRTPFKTADASFLGPRTVRGGGRARVLNLCKLGRSFGAGCLIPGGAYPNEPSYQDTYGKGEAVFVIIGGGVTRSF